jgi:sulfatase maturation enzyme AslB (radical SAM superfamily)
MVEDMKNRDTWDEFADNLDVDLKYPTQLDLKIGNYCNLSCRMCSSFSSSKYAAEFKKIYNDTGIDYGVDEHEKNYVQSKWYDDDKFVEYVYKFIDNGLTHLKFTGGEPLMVPNVKKILQYCIDSGKADSMYFNFITNGTLFSESWMSIFEKFTHRLNISISIDGIGDTYEYIRYPTNWTDVREKLAMFGTWDNPRFGDAVRINLTFTLQIYNMLETKNIVDLARDLGCYAVPITLDKPSYLDVKNAPEQLKTDAIAMLDAIVTRTAEEERFVRDCKRKIMQEPDTPHQKLKEEFVMMSRLKDKYRNQSFDAIEVSKYYE